MTVMEFFGCGFIAFGPPVALFIFTIAPDPLRVIVLMASAFFWLLSLLISSLLWFVVRPLQDQLAFGLVFSVIFQETFRILFYFLLRKANEGLQKVTQQEPGSRMQLATNPHLMSYVSGLGFGIIAGAFSLVNVLADSTGPGTIGIHGDSDLFFITSAFLTLAFVLLHTFWGIISFAGMDRKHYGFPILVVGTHMLVSCLTLLNQGTSPIYLATLIPAYVVTIAMGTLAYFIAGGSLRNLKTCINSRHAAYSLD